MSKLLTTLLAAVFAAVTVTPVAFAAEAKKDEMKTEKKAAPKKEAAPKKKAEPKKSEGKKKAEEKK
jgi:Ni/Co efflux regulator RcnB